MTAESFAGTASPHNSDRAPSLEREPEVNHARRGVHERKSKRRDLPLALVVPLYFTRQLPHFLLRGLDLFGGLIAEDHTHQRGEVEVPHDEFLLRPIPDDLDPGRWLGE